MSLKIERDNGESFEVNLTCDHVTYLHFCPRCKKTADTETNMKLKKCPTCGNKKLDTPKPSPCTHREARHALSRLDAAGKKVTESDNALIKRHLGIDPDKAAKDKWYCPTHRGLHG